MQNIRWVRVFWGVLVGAIILAIVFGVWYWYAIWFPAWQASKTNLNVNQLQQDFWKTYCTTGKYKNDKIKNLCLQIEPEVKP